MVVIIPSNYGYSDLEYMDCFWNWLIIYIGYNHPHGLSINYLHKKFHPNNFMIVTKLKYQQFGLELHTNGYIGNIF